MFNFLKSVPFVKYLLDIRRELSLIRFQTTNQTRILQQIYTNAIKAEKIHEDSFPSKYEHQTFSQNGEDGIILEIFRRIKVAQGTFIEMGTGDGSENNTRLLLELGWSGTWIDGDSANILLCKENLRRFTDLNLLTIINSFIDEQNVNTILQKLKVPVNVDFLSIDLDLTTHVVWEKIDSIKPKVVAIEYNGFFPDSTHWEAITDKNETWDGSINMGASLSTITEISRTKGYKHIGCDLTGTNAFFLLDDLAQKYFSNLKENLYEPARPFLNNDAAHQR